MTKGWAQWNERTRAPPGGMVLFLTCPRKWPQSQKFLPVFISLEERYLFSTVSPGHSSMRFVSVKERTESNSGQGDEKMVLLPVQEGPVSYHPQPCTQHCGLLCFSPVDCTMEPRAAAGSVSKSWWRPNLGFPPSLKAWWHQRHPCWYQLPRWQPGKTEDNIFSGNYFPIRWVN